MEEKKKFSAEVDKILHLMIHSLYSNKEIFIRELISNSSDACDKLRYLSQTDGDLISPDHQFRIKVKIDKEKRLITISDTGIGMNKEDLVENIGTIAKSGTQKFIEQLTNDKKNGTNLIGQFGVGFYSSYMVAKNITVVSKKAGEDKTYFWKSDGSVEYVVGEYEDRDKNGTDIIIEVKDGEDSYLDHFKVKNIIKNYSDHISVPIFYEEEDGKETKVNSSSALWTRSKSEITDDQYKEFYKSVSHSVDDPWSILHNKNEGVIEFTNLLFIPSDKTFDLYHPDRTRRVKLYIKKVFITDENIDLVPRYLRFVRGVVDSEDLPLNISRETLQHNKVIEKIQNSITKRVLDELETRLSEKREEYEKFWSNFGPVIKEGLCEFTEHKDKLLDICVFKSALHNKYVTLAEYIISMKQNQKQIYCLTGDDETKLRNSPQIEGLISKGYDVLLLTDGVDDFWINIQNKYKDHDIVSVTKADLDLSEDDPENISKDNKEGDDKKDVTDSEHKELVEFFKKQLEDSVKDVKVSKRLTNSPVCLVSSSDAMDIRMERFLIEQKQLSKASAKILEINPKHKLIQKIANDIKGGKDEKDNKDLAIILFDQACIAEGESIGDVNNFNNKVNNFLERIVT